MPNNHEAFSISATHDAQEEKMPDTDGMMTSHLHQPSEWALLVRMMIPTSPFNSPHTFSPQGGEKKVPAKYSDTCSIRADGLCIRRG